MKKTGLILLSWLTRAQVQLHHLWITQDEAQELLECLFVKLNEFAHVDGKLRSRGVNNDDLRNIALAGQTPSGEDACNRVSSPPLFGGARTEPASRFELETCGLRNRCSTN